MSNDPITISNEIVSGWQRVVDLMAKIIDVPAGLVMRLMGEDIEVFISSQTEGNPYKPGDREHFCASGLYCEKVINSKHKLLVPDALADPQWRNNPDVKLNMISYLGFPLLFPDGKPFGTICVLDNKPNTYTKLYEELVASMQSIIQHELAMLYVNQTLGDKNKRLEEYVEEIKALRGLVPICAHCKSVRNDKGFWEAVEAYLGKHLGTSFTHGICPECLEREYPDMAADILKKL
jgi:GAF domain-containing protein